MDTLSKAIEQGKGTFVNRHFREIDFVLTTWRELIFERCTFTNCIFERISIQQVEFIGTMWFSCEWLDRTARCRGD